MSRPQVQCKWSLHVSIQPSSCRQGSSYHFKLREPETTMAIRSTSRLENSTLPCLGESVYRN